MKYIENRVWLYGGFINFENRLMDLSFLRDLTFFNLENLEIVTNFSYLFPFDTMPYFEIKLNKQGIREFNERFNSKDDFRLTDLHIRYFDGFIQTISIFDYLKDLNINEFDTETIELVSVIDKFTDEIVELTKQFSTNNFITINKEFDFGVPQFLKSMMSYEETNFLQRHIIIHKNTLYSIAEKDNVSLKSFYNTYHFLFKGNSMHFWEEQILENSLEFLNVDFIIFAELTLYYYFNLIAEKTLKFLYLNINYLDSTAFRQIINFVNILLLNLRDAQEALNAELKALYLYCKENQNLEEKYSFFKDTENRLKFTIEGIENKINEKQNENLQLIFLFFTLLTIYSTINDIIEIFQTDNFWNNQFLYLKIGILAIGFVIIGFLYKRIRKTLKSN